MSRVRLVHWNAAEAEELAGPLRGAGHEVVAGLLDRDGLLALRDGPPDVIVISLDRLPSHGREVGLSLRSFKATRHVPLVFVGGAPEKAARLRELLPDARYGDWDGLPETVLQALSEPVVEPIVPASTFAAYAGRPLAQKLGIKPGAVVGLVGAPEGFEATLGSLPEGAALHRGPDEGADLVLWFARWREELERGVERMGALAGKGGLWIMWPKRSSGVASDLTQIVVRKVGLAAGLVDYKVSAIDATWSGLRFTRRKTRIV